MYTTCVVVYSTIRSSSYFCNIDCYEIASPVKVINYFDVNFLKSISSAVYAFVYLFITYLSFLKYRLKLKLHLRYLNIHFF